jgi:hypothetical protein
MNEENVAKWERIIIRVAGLILLLIIVIKIIGHELGIPLFQ